MGAPSSGLDSGTKSREGPTTSRRLVIERRALRPAPAPSSGRRARKQALQLGELNRLDRVFVKSGFSGLCAIRLFPAPRQRDEEDPLASRLSPQLAYDVETGHAGHSQVED